MTTPLPDSWDEEPWPLDDPTPAPSLNPTNWSDTHDDPPQVADLGDEAWQLAVDEGISMEQALTRLQRQAMRPSNYGFATGGIVQGPTTVTINGVDISDIIKDARMDRFYFHEWKPSVDQSDIWTLPPDHGNTA